MLTQGAWHDIVLNFKLSYTEGGGGFFNVWVDGDLMHEDMGINCYNDTDEPYFKFGLYDTGSTTADVVYYDEIRIGDSNSYYDEVAPGASAPVDPGLTNPKYVGWTTASGEPTTDPSGTELRLDGDRTYLRKWVASQGGTVYSVRFFVEASGWDSNATWVICYRRQFGNNTMTLIGVAAISDPVVTDDWTGEYVLGAYADVPMSFSAGDELYFGIAADPTSTTSCYIGRENTGTSPLYYMTDTLQGYPLTTIDNVEGLQEGTTSFDMPFVLGYNSGPVVSIDFPSGGSGYVSGHTVYLSGTAGGDEIVVTWETDHGNSGVCSGDTAWYANDVPVSAGVTVVTVTATDSEDNTDTDTFTVTLQPVESWTFEGYDEGAGSGGLPTTTPTESASVTAYITVLRSAWTVTTESDIRGMYFWAGDWDITNAWLVVYKENADGLGVTLIAKSAMYGGEYIAAYDSWNYWSFGVAESGQSLTVRVGEKLLFGIVVDPGSTGFTYGVETTGGAGMLTSTIGTSSGPAATLDYSSQLSATSDYDPAFTLIFEPVYAVNMADLTGTWQSPTHDFGAVVKVKVWGDFIADFDSAGEAWEDNFPGGVAWSALGLGGGSTARAWREIFAMTRSGKIRATLLAQDANTDWDTNATRYDFFEMQSVEIENRYVRVEVTITDPTKDSHVYLKVLNLYAYTGPGEV